MAWMTVPSRPTVSLEAAEGDLIHRLVISA